MGPLPATRIIDANLNRTAEGLRTLEDIARYVLDDALLSQQLKDLRHNLVRGALVSNLELLRSRDSTGDVGAGLTAAGEEPLKDLPVIAVANSRRVQESLRVLEEMTKLPGTSPWLESENFKRARFQVYSIEQRLVSLLVRQKKLRLISGLYVLLDTQALKGRNHLAAAREIIDAGVKAIQLRDKCSPKKAVLAVAKDLQALCTQSGVVFIVNDYLDVALAVDADGLHVGQDDLPCREARRLLPADKVLGCSVSGPEEAVEAQADGADYLGVGCLFPTSSKETTQAVGLDCLSRTRRAVTIPIVAIGGITLENAGEVMQAGADAISVISAVLGAPDMGLAARQIMKKVEK
jgi:thiamine-phosphate pyrophosphorylase